MECLPIRIVTWLKASGLQIIDEVYEKVTTELLNRQLWQLDRLQPLDDKDRLLIQEAAALSLIYLPSTELNIYGRNFVARYTPRHVTNRYYRAIVCRIAVRRV